jgi:hypothetical protein
LLFTANPHDRDGLQEVEIIFNGVLLDKCRLSMRHEQYGVLVDENIIDRDGFNNIAFKYFHLGRAVEINYPENDDRLFLFVRKLYFGSEYPIDSSRTLPEAEVDPGRKAYSSANIKSVAEQFQSLGQNCEFGLFQRQCGAEPIGLLRLSGIYLNRLISALETSFERIGNIDELSFYLFHNNEYIGNHLAYDLHYHTGRFKNKIDLPVFQRTESNRLKYLAGLLMEQIVNGDKIFVIKRMESELEECNVLPLLHELRKHNRNIRLLWISEATEINKNLIGKVYFRSNGFLQGYIDRFAPLENAHALSFQCWRKLCLSALKAFEL